MSYTDVVYNRALQGTSINPGLPQRLSQLVAGQSQHESDNFSSNVFLHSFNGFGYKYVGSMYQVGSYNGYGTYNSLDDSTAEIVDWIYRRRADGSFPNNLNMIQTADDYAAWLKNANYYEDTQSNYANGIAAWLDQDVFTTLQQQPWIGVAVLGAIVVGGYFIARKSKKAA
jgi:hypothetical protein